MPKKPSRKTLVKKLDTVFSEYIRRRYAKNDITECVTCGKQDHWKKLQAGHFMSRKYYSTRWNEENVQVQCVACNVYRYGEQYKFGIYLGKEKSEELLAESRKILKITNYELIEKINSIGKYLSERESLRLILSVIDARHEPSGLDQDFFYWLASNEMPFCVLMSKADKLSKNKVAQSKKVVKNILAEMNIEVPILEYSASSRKGIPEIQELIKDFIKD